MQYVWERGAVDTGFWWEKLLTGENLKDPGVDGMLILKWISKK